MKRQGLKGEGVEEEEWGGGKCIKQKGENEKRKGKVGGGQKEGCKVPF